MTHRKSIGIYSLLSCEPLLRKIAPLGFTVVVDPPLQTGINLRDRKLDAALVSPIDYARDGSLYRIIPGTAVSSRGASNAAVLHFRKGIHTVTSLAVDTQSLADIILARIILAEEFDVAPSVVPVAGRVDAMLARADAALVTGDDALRHSPREATTIDLVEAWDEMTGLPFVHGLFCCRERSLNEEEARSVSALAPVEDAVLESVAADASVTHALPGNDAASLFSYLASFSYELTDEVKNGTVEFLKFAFYHGILPDVPELNFLSPSDDAEIEIDPPMN